VAPKNLQQAWWGYLHRYRFCEEKYSKLVKHFKSFLFLKIFHFAKKFLSITMSLKLTNLPEKVVTKLQDLAVPVFKKHLLA